VGTKLNGALHLLTAREVFAAQDGYHTDGGGLVLRVSARSASWVLRFTAPSGRRREMGLGAVSRGSLALAGKSLTGARDAAAAARDALRRGVDPLAARAQAKEVAKVAEAARKDQRARDHWTLARCARDYHEREVEPSCTELHAAQWIKSLENHVPVPLWQAPIASITAPALLAGLQGVQVHERARKHSNLGETLRRIRQRLDAVFEDAMFHGRCQANPAAAIGRKLAKTRPVKAGALAALDYKQAPALMARLRAMEGTAARCLEFAVLTAARTSEALLAEWSEFDLDVGVHHIPSERMKRGEPHTVLLPPRAIAIVKAQLGQDPRYVFPSPMPSRQGKPLSDMALLSVLGRLGVRDRTTVHGLCRATFSTWANETAAARPDVVEACLAHQEVNLVRAAYNRARFNDERRVLLAAWAQFLSMPATRVIPIRAASSIAT
jgi:integrase